MASKVKAFYSKKTLALNGNVMDLSVPRIMGVLNLTPDSFYDGGKYNNIDKIEQQLDKIISEGADIIDIGGYSSRPGAEDITTEEEFNRIKTCLNILTKQFPDIPVSIDTFRSEIARRAIDSGASMINDISGGSLDPLMFETIATLNVPYVLMHMRGTPGTMQKMTDYENLTKNVFDDLQKKYSILVSLGVNDVIIDMGFGFAKSISQNYELLRNLDYFKVLNVPILVGISRKSMIYKKLKINPDESLNGTTVLNTIALIKGASILRVHDVKQAKEAITLYNLTVS